MLLELSDEKDNYEIVNYHYISDDWINRKEKVDNNLKVKVEGQRPSHRNNY